MGFEISVARRRSRAKLNEFFRKTRCQSSNVFDSKPSYPVEEIRHGETVMLRKTMIALLATAAAAAFAPGMASARGFGGGGGGGFHGGFGGGGGFHSGAIGGGGGFRGAMGSVGGFRSAPVGNSALNANALARGPIGNGNVVAHGFHPGFGHGFHHGRGFVIGGAGLGYGYYDPYAYYGDDYDSYYGDDGGCYVVQQRVHTRYGWRIRPVQVCG
jgi:hypothetical protein